MDIYGAIRELEQEKKRLDGVIGSLETLMAEGGNPSTVLQMKPRRRRGRKEMNPDERLAVSERMRKYWEARRAKPGA